MGSKTKLFPFRHSFFAACSLCLGKIKSEKLRVDPGRKFQMRFVIARTSEWFTTAARGLTALLSIRPFEAALWIPF